MQQTTQSSGALVSVQWLKQHLNDPELRIVNASWHMPATGRDASSEHKAEHIKGAVFFDIEEFSAVSDLPHMLPGADEFCAATAALGVSASNVIVVYDTTGIFSAARVWWMYRYYGAAHVHVLDGGFPAWKAIDGDIGSGVTTYPRCEFQPIASHGTVADSSQVLAASDSGNSLILDARSHARFTGAEKEARSGLRSGHIPGSCSLPFTTLLRDGHLKNKQELAEIFKAQDIDLNQPIITTCGSGVTAAVIILALEILGVDNAILYDGSWSEWGASATLPVQTE